MENYKSNSDKSRTQELPDKKVEKVIRGSVKTKKKNEVRKFADVFISEDAHNVGSYVFSEVFVPAVKKAVSDIVKDGIDMIFYGSTNHKDRSRDGGMRPSYRSFYDDRNDRREYKPQVRSLYSFDDIILDNRADAEEVLDNMGDIIERYGVVSVADMYDLVGVTGNYTDYNYGWTDLRTAHVERDRSGGYFIKLPKALPL